MKQNRGDYMELDHNAGQALSDKQNNVIKLDKEWMKRLERNQNKSIKSNRRNVQIILENDENLKNIGRLNEFSGFKEIYHTPKWRRTNDVESLWSDFDDSQIRTYLDVHYGINNEASINDVLNNMFYDNSYHPVRSYLRELNWDGNNRLETLFINFLGADDSDYTKQVTKIMLVGAVTRIFNPATKFDTALILIGSQGVGKSYVLSRLGGEWFNESINSFSGDEALMKLRNSWIIELAELSAMKSSEVEEVKAFISATVDTYRPKYSRNISRFPRQCVFFGSTNNYEFLKDKTGNRRFLPLPVNKESRKKNPFEELTDEYVNQVWAEAYHLYSQDTPIHITDDSVQRRAEQLQHEHMSDDGLKGVIEEYISKNFMNRVCARQIWFEALGNIKQPKRHDISDINEVLRSLDGWKEYDSPKWFGKHGAQRGFYKSTDDDIEI